MPGHLYIHIPFCTRKCAYCDFLSVPYDESLAVRYAEALCGEIRMNAGGTLKTIYVGGGTPSLLPGKIFGDILGSIHECFDLDAGCEVSVETNPGSIDREKATELKRLGINRISLGVQSFDDLDLATLGRSHGAREAISALEVLEPENVSLDLIYGIPGQDVRGWKASLLRALGLGARHVSAYELTPEKGTPFADSVNRGLVEMPEEELVIEMYEIAKETLTGAGLVHYEISNYSLPGLECRHNLNCWDRGEYMGLGAGAHSHLGGRRLRNTDDILKYIGLLSEGESPVDETLTLSEEDAAREYFFLGLRKTEGVDVGIFGADIPEAASGLIEEGLVEYKGGRLCLTDRGLVLFNPVVLRLFEILGL
jgi:oxygen-independent coproporphyrinogen-3 oxidase